MTATGENCRQEFHSHFVDFKIQKGFSLTLENSKPNGNVSTSALIKLLKTNLN